MKFAQINLILLAMAVSFSVIAADLRVDFIPQFNGKPLAFDALKYQVASGQKISVTRLDFLLSRVVLRGTNGVWIENKNEFAYISARNGKNSFTLANVPAGNYDAIRFQIGLPPQINHGDIAQWPPDHPLNPDVNGLYWGWSKEYVFLAFEGHWESVAAVYDRRYNNSRGFSYHIATDRELMTVELPVKLDLRASREIQIALNADKIFSAPNQIQLSDETDTSHSRTNDLLVAQLRENIENAFAIVGQALNLSLKSKLEANQENKESSPPLLSSVKKFVPLIAPNATPYRLTISAFVPQPDLPRDNPLTVEGVALGSKLFFDKHLSENNTESCATCHRPQNAFAQPRRFSRGADGDIGTRNAMSLENLAWKNSFFWDGRTATIRQQVLEPIQNPIEMHESLTNLVAKVSADKDYQRLFEKAFGSPEINSDRIARALEQFLLAQVSFNSKFDRVLAGRETFTAEEARGYVLFNTEYDPYHGQHGADCFHCHGGPLFQSLDFANNGLDSAFTDLGRYKVTKRAGDEGKFAVPSLRNVAVTAPYMHDGRFQTLEQAVAHYCAGMKRSATLDPNLAKHPDGGVPLSKTDQQALVAFLKTLTDEKYLKAAPQNLATK